MYTKETTNTQVLTCCETNFLRLLGGLAQGDLLHQQLLGSQGGPHHATKLKTLRGQELHIGGQNGPGEGLHVLLDKLQQNIAGLGEAASEDDHVGIHHTREVDAQHRQMVSGLLY